MTERNDAAESPTAGTKIDRVARKYGLEGVETELLDRRRGRAGEKHSLRALESYFNERVVRAALERAEETPLDGEARNLYRLLTSDEVTEGTRTEARGRLERAGVDVAAVEADFVSYQTVNRFLDARAAEDGSDAVGTDENGETDDRPTPEALMERLFKLESRLSAVTTSTLQQLRDRSDFSLGEFDVYVSVTVTCEDCGARRNLRAILDRRGCDC